MTIQLPVSPAYAIDYLAILAVKADSGLQVSDELDLVQDSLHRQIPNLEAVLASREYLVLLRSNQSVFDAVAASKTSPTQTANRARYRAKVALQKKFWPNEPLSEVKTKTEC